MNVKIKGLKSLKKKLEKIDKSSAVQIADSINDGLRLIDRTAKEGMRKTPKGDNGRSKPGKYPAVDTDDLITGLDIEEATAMALYGTFGSSIAHGYYLEFGTSKMSARPWLKPSFDKNKKAIKKKYRGFS